VKEGQRWEGWRRAEGEEEDGERFLQRPAS